MFTRRLFLQMGAGLVSAAMPLHAARKLRVGVGTYSYHNLSLNDMLVQLRALRVEEVEMSRGEFMLLSHPTGDLFRTARAKLDRAGIHCVSYYAATLKANQDVEDALRFAKLLGARNVTGDGPAAILAQVDKRFTQEGLSFGLHNHFFKGEKFPYESPADVLKALAPLSKTVGATADVGQFASCGHDPLEAIRKLGPRLKLVHLKDVKASGGEVNVLLGKGICRIPEVMAELRRQNFQGLVAVEYEKEGDVNDDMREEVAFARSLA
jgi:sugar phosphate isomerase/epimerase